MSDKKASSTVPNQAAPTAPATKKPAESKAEKFKRLANMRVSKALKVLTHIRNLANHRQYERTPEQTSKLLRVLKDAYDDVVAAYNGAPVSQSAFSL